MIMESSGTQQRLQLSSQEEYHLSSRQLVDLSEYLIIPLDGEMA